jgi:hypothetical protein
MKFLKKKKVLVERHRNTEEHSHTLQESDSLKRPPAVKQMIAAEAVKPYPPRQVATVVKELGSKCGLAGPVELITTKEVANMQVKLRGPQTTHLFAQGSLKQDIKSSIDFLAKQGYSCAEFSAMPNSYQGFTFAQPNQLQKLLHFGWLTLMDSTHNTNKWRWQLFTLYVRDGCGCWVVGAHFFLAGEDGRAIANGLREIRRLVPNWQPRYMLVDQSSIECSGIMEAFPGVANGEQQCSILWCSVHVMRTWMRKVTHTGAKSKMLLAMHKKTKVGCQEMIEQAISCCDAPHVQRYITRNWTKNSDKWARHARMHSPLLLQVTSTNALESYHSELKTRTAKIHGLIGICFYLYICNV